MSHSHQPVEPTSAVRERRRLADCKKMAFRRAIEARAEERRLQEMIEGYAFMAPRREPAPAAGRC
jgi:hypothetical protein